MKGYIYRIIDNTNGNVYYGSTIKKYLCQRIASHKADYKRYLEGISRYTTSFDIIKNNDYKYEVVEENEFETKYDILQRERYYIENFECVNRIIPNRTEQEYRDTHKEQTSKKNKNYYETHKQEFVEKSKKYHKENYEKKKEQLKKKRKDSYEKNKEYLKEKINCDCGAIVCRVSLTRHKKSKKHLDKII